MSTLTPSGQPAVRHARRTMWRAIALWSAFAAVVVLGVILAAANGNSVPVLLDEVVR
jgi:hypothetical protein